MVTLKIPVNVALYISKREKKKTRKKEKRKQTCRQELTACQGFFGKYYPTTGGVEILQKTRRASTFTGRYGLPNLFSFLIF
jgi:hypothetical protein